MLRTLIRQIGRYRTASLLTPLLTAGEVILDVFIPYVTASLIDKGINAGNLQAVWHYGALMLLMAFLSLTFGIWAGRMSAYASTGFAANLRSAMYRNIQTFAFSNIDKFTTSGLVTRMTTDVQNLQQAFQQVLRITVRAPFRLLFSIVMCLVIAPRLSLIFVIAVVILAFTLWQIISRVSRLFQQVFERYDALNLSVQENIIGIRLVKAFVRERHESDKFAHAAEALYKLYVRAESLMALNHPIMNMVVYGCIIALSWWGAQFIVEGTLTTGQLTSLFTYVMSILQSLMMLSMIFVMLSQSAASGNRVCEVINEQADITSPPDGLQEVPDGSIEFKGVRFDYDSHQSSVASPSRKSALYNVSFRIESGQTVGVIGGTGSGKSTLVSLISRLYDPTRGEVIVGGSNVRDYDLTALRSAVSIVLQQNLLFSGTVLDNLRWGDSLATEDACRAACRLACADEFVSQMPDGYYSYIGQGGSNVSGGQRQRLCIARALLKKPKILILDDATSACDTRTDARIRQALSTQLPRMTKLIIAQRIQSIIGCDRILVLDNGMVTGFGTHEELLATNVMYREIFDLQMHDAGDFDAARLKGGAT